MSNKKNFEKFPTLSIIIVTKNVERTLPRLLKNIGEQIYPKNKLDVIIVDGKSSDRTLEIIEKSRLNVKVYQGKYPNDPEACKGEGLSFAKGEIVGLIDSDNYLPHKNWFKNMLMPLIENKDVVGSYAWRFAYRKKDYILNRYFSLIGSADPVGLYLGKADKMSYISDKWIGFGKVIENHKKYFVIQLDQKHFPTLGSNGFFARRKALLKGKADPKNFFHIDVPFDILKFNLDKYAVVRDVVVHDTAVGLVTFVKKRAKYMRLHYQKRANDRRYYVFDPKSKRDILKLFTFILFTTTIIQPLYVSIKGFFKIKDRAWFLHPVVCFSIMTTYILVILLKSFRK